MSVCSGVRVVLIREPTAFTSLKSAAHVSLVRPGGGSTRNCELLFMLNGVTLAIHGTRPGANDGSPGSSDGVGLHWPIALLPKNGGGLGGKRPSLERRNRMSAATCWPTFVPGSPRSRRHMFSGSA